jgi:hypothetical protein
MTELEKLRQEIKVLEKKLELLEEIEKHNAKPKMNLENEGEFSIVSYDGRIYYRLEYPTGIMWYEKTVDDWKLYYVEDNKELETLYLQSRTYCPDEPSWYDEIEHDISENVENKTIRDVIDRWWMDTFTSKNMSSVNECIDDLADQVEFWILRNKK